MITLLDDPSEQVCQAALQELGTLGDPRAIPALQALLAHPKARFRLLALRSLELVDRLQTLPRLLTVPHLLTFLLIALHDPSVTIRREAVFMLKTLRDAHAVPPLMAALSDTWDNANTH